MFSIIFYHFLLIVIACVCGWARCVLVRSPAISALAISVFRFSCRWVLGFRCSPSSDGHSDSICEHNHVVMFRERKTFAPLTV